MLNDVKDEKLRKLKEQLNENKNKLNKIKKKDNNNNISNLNLDCPDSIGILIPKGNNLKCFKCNFIPYFTLYNCLGIKLHTICEDGHSMTSILDDYIKNSIKQSKNESFCNICNKNEDNNMIFCQFCKKFICKQCNSNHFTIHHIFKNNILENFKDENIFKTLNHEDKSEINQIREIFNQSVSYLKSVADYFKEIENNFQNFMINNLNEILLIKMLFEDYLFLKKENENNSNILLENILFLASFNNL